MNSVSLAETALVRANTTPTTFTVVELVLAAATRHTTIGNRLVEFHTAATLAAVDVNEVAR